MSTPGCAVILGGTAGIGCAIGRGLIARGWSVYALARSPRELASEAGGIEFLQCDLADEASIERAFEEFAGRSAHLDALVCAAAQAPSGPIEQMSSEAVMQAFHVNVGGPLVAVRLALPHLRKSSGSILFMGSTLADHPRPHTAVYAATKGALDSVTKALAVDLGPEGVRVNCLRPSMVRTELMVRNGMDPARYETLLEHRARVYPMRRIGEVNDLVAMAVLLLSRESSWTTGSVIDVDGGHSAAGS